MSSLTQTSKKSLIDRAIPELLWMSSDWNFHRVNFLMIFPDEYPRSADIEPTKKDTVFDDVPDLLAARARRIREYLKYRLDETEIIIISHGSFIHFLLDWWAGEPGKSRSLSTQLQFGRAKPFTIPGRTLPGLELEPLVDYSGPYYPLTSKQEDFSDAVSLRGIRDCGIFTVESVRNA